MVESLLIFSLIFESFKWYWCWCFVLAGFPGMFKIFFKAPQPLACDGDGDVNLEVTVKKKAKDLTYVLQMVHTHLVVVVMLRQKGKRSKVTFDKGCTGGCSPSWGGCRAGHEQPGQGNPLPPSYILIRTTSQCGNRNLTLRLIYILLHILIQITSQLENRKLINAKKCSEILISISIWSWEVYRSVYF